MCTSWSKNILEEKAKCRLRFLALFIECIVCGTGEDSVVPKNIYQYIRQSGSWSTYSTVYCRQSRERLGGQMFGRSRGGAVRSLTNIYSLVSPQCVLQTGQPYQTHKVGPTHQWKEKCQTAPTTFAFTSYIFLFYSVRSTVFGEQGGIILIQDQSTTNPVFKTSVVAYLPSVDNFTLLLLLSSSKIYKTLVSC